jgi:hypothetical protein
VVVRVLVGGMDDGNVSFRREVFLDGLFGKLTLCEFIGLELCIFSSSERSA